jgi:hypothetical protein
MNCGSESKREENTGSKSNVWLEQLQQTVDSRDQTADVRQQATDSR